MKIRLIRNATLLVEYGSKRFLVDPALSSAGTFDSMPSPLYPGKRNPMTPLPIPGEEIVRGIDSAIITHIHPDHLDQAGADLIPKDIPVFVQNILDKDQSRNYGFKKQFTTDITMLTAFQDVQLIRAPGKHGDGTYQHVLNEMANSSGVVFKHSNEKTLYLTGDTVWYFGVQDTINRHNPSVIVANVGAAVKDDMRLIMGLQDLKALHEYSPEAKIVCIHLEAWNHCTITRQDVRKYAEANGFAEYVFVPEDGEELQF